ncbi:MAG: hypothetical protein DVB29_06310 [Verrucomicrobia bacterium]|nr:MAG: hypothetical protein DVB29_06310 [Verrucomicrobiota bacterium]
MGCCARLHFDLGGRDSYSPESKYSPALTRSLQLVSPFQGCLKEVSGSLPRGLPTAGGSLSAFEASSSRSG